MKVIVFGGAGDMGSRAVIDLAERERIERVHHCRPEYRIRAKARANACRQKGNFD